MAQVLRHVHNTGVATHPDLLVGIQSVDDAGVYRISDDVALVQTVDFFTPVVDDAYDWGRIAAVNALSDVYAMGGTPLTALQVVGWPREKLPFELLGEVLQGAAEVLAQANCTLVGGHSIDDNEPKFGMAVTGVVHPDDITTNGGGKAGDVLVLTKPLGSGIIATAIKRDRATPEQRDTVVEVMAALNDGSSRAMRRIGVRAATDVTGYGLLGHLGEMIRASGVSARIEAEAVPLLEGVVDLAEAGVVPGGTYRNLESVQRFVSLTDDVPEVMQTVLADAQTSGGLLMAVDAPLAEALLAALRDEDSGGWIIGALVERSFANGPSGMIEVV